MSDCSGGLCIVFRSGLLRLCRLFLNASIMGFPIGFALVHMLTLCVVRTMDLCSRKASVMISVGECPGSFDRAGCSVQIALRTDIVNRSANAFHMLSIVAITYIEH